MLIFLIFLKILFLSLILIFYGEEKNIDGFRAIGHISSIVIGFFFFVAMMVLLFNGANSRKIANQLNIDSANLNYYIHHLEDYNERTLVEAINKYNVELKDFRAKQSSPWLNWFYPGDISECDYIIWKDKNG